MKGFAKMAIAKSSHELLTPQPTLIATEPPTISPRLVVSAKHSSQVAQIPVPTISIAEEKCSRSATTTPIHVRASSFPAPMLYYKCLYSSPVEIGCVMGQLFIKYFLLPSPSLCPSSRLALACCLCP